MFVSMNVITDNLMIISIYIQLYAFFFFENHRITVITATRFL